MNQESTVTYHESSLSKRTPLPKFQLFIVFLIQLAEPITGTVIYPFVNQFVRDTGITQGDERKTGYYAGILAPTFFFAEAFTVFHWGRLSDRLGRRPILLFGPLGLSLAMLAFGLSNNFWNLVISRCLQGVFNGNIGVSKSVMGEITDSTNVAEAYTMIPLMWSFGTTIGPIIGGLLAEPAKTWPELFGRMAFFNHYPYFLPCAVAALVAFFSWLIAFIGLKETLPAAILKEKRRQGTTLSVTPGITTGLLTSDNRPYGCATTANDIQSEQSAQDPLDFPLPFSERLSRILLTLVVYGFSAFIDMSSLVFQPLVYSTSISLGGLGLDPYRIGTIMGTWGIINAVVQVLFLARAIRKIGARNLEIISLLSYAFSLSLYPLLSFLAKRAGRVDGFVWSVMAVQLFLALTNISSYACVQILILDVAPNRSSLGATNGMAQAVGSAMRSVAPSVASSLFSISLQHQFLGGNMVFLILVLIALIGVRLTFMIPDKAQHAA